MTHKSNTWDYSWPPDYESTFEPTVEAIAKHRATVMEWLTHSPACKALSEDQVFALCTAIWHIDLIASQATQFIARTGFSMGELRDLSAKPPKKKLNNFIEARSKLMCIDNCRLTRDLVFNGKWGTAIASAIQVGTLSLHDDALRGSAMIIGVGNSAEIRSAQPMHAERDTQLFREAYEMKRRSSMSWSAISKKLSEKPGYPKAEAIRKIIRRYEALGK